MTIEPARQMLDNVVYEQFKQAVHAGSDTGILDSLDAAAASLKASPYFGDLSEISVGTILTIMVDSIRVMTGEISGIGRHRPSVFDADDPVDRGVTQQWQHWLHSLESLALVTGTHLGPLPQAIREEFIEISGQGASPSPTARLIRLWRASRPFLFSWMTWSLLSADEKHNGDKFGYDLHMASLGSIMSYLFGLRENWSDETEQTYALQIEYVKENVALSIDAMNAEIAESMQGWDDDESYEDEVTYEYEHVELKETS